MNATPCRKTFPPNARISIATADKLIELIGAQGVEAIIRKPEIFPSLGPDDIEGFAERNLQDFDRTGAA